MMPAGRLSVLSRSIPRMGKFIMRHPMIITKLRIMRPVTCHQHWRHASTVPYGHDGPIVSLMISDRQ
eukprot:766562-Hanusia_phi.AAC.3